jgi:recombination protein RecA
VAKGEKMRSTGKQFLGLDKIVSSVRADLKHGINFEKPPGAYLQTGDKEVNAVLGHQELGIPFGRMIEVSGMESHGKTALAMAIASLAVHTVGAVVPWLDGENSYEEDWAAKRGLPRESVALIKPYMGTFKRKKKGVERNVDMLSSGEVLCNEATKTVEALANAGHKHIVLVVDSLPSLVPENTLTTGLEHQSMRNNGDLAMLLGKVLPLWVGLGSACNLMVLLINQLRAAPAQRGDPMYQPGGNALKFYCQVRARVRKYTKSKGGVLLGKMGVPAGIAGEIICTKNKVGGVEGAKVGYQIWRDGAFAFKKLKGAKPGEEDEEDGDEEE